MLAKIWTRIGEAKRSLRRSFGQSIDTPMQRFWAQVHYNLFDHAFLRILWTNFDQVAPGVYRSNLPTRRRFRRYAKMGIKTVVNLRGEEKHANYLLEKENCADFGMTLLNAKLSARRAPTPEALLKVIDAMRGAERPFLMHCKSGADRAGLSAATYLMVFEDQPVDVAARQLSFRYLHLKSTQTGVHDYLLEVYAARLKTGGQIGFEDWVATEYDPEAVQTGFDNRIPAATSQETA